jgi:hypothetical protein
MNPTLAMLFEAIIGSGLQSLEDLSIGMLNLAISQWVSHRGITDVDLDVFTMALEHLARELSASISDDPVRYSKAVYNGLDELDSL